MITERNDKAHVGPDGTRKHQFVAMFIALVFAAMIYPQRTQAQLIGTMEADIPFQFHAGNAKFPAGKYVIRVLDSTDLTVMEISSADGTHSALFEVHDAQAKNVPAKSELIFNRYGNRYFLARLFDEGNPDGADVVESNYEKRVGRATAEAQERVPAHRAHSQPGN